MVQPMGVPENPPPPMPADLDGKGYLEDRRPCANIDPYVVARLLLEAA